MPFFQEKSHRRACTSAERPIILRELLRLYQSKCSTVTQDIRFCALLSEKLPFVSCHLSSLASNALPYLSRLEQVLQTASFSPESGQTTHNVPSLSKENTHAVALAYCQNRLQATQTEQAFCRHLQRFAATQEVQELLGSISDAAQEDAMLLESVKKRITAS